MNQSATTPELITPTASSVNLFTHFADLPDPRIDRTKHHKLIDIVGITICAVICGADGWAAIEEYGHAKEAWLREFFELPAGIPSDDTFRRVFTGLSPTQFQDRFVTWVQAISAQTGGQVVAIDGKTARRSYDRGDNKGAIHMVSAWASADHLVLGQLKTDAKSNEITAIPDLLQMLALEGCIVTIDAMGCQTAIAGQIVDQEADYVLALKENQGTTYQHVVEFFDRVLGPLPAASSPATSPPEVAHTLDVAQQQEQLRRQAHQGRAWDQAATGHETVDGEHGRLEFRRYYQVSDLSWLDERSRWKGLQSIGLVEAERHIEDQVSIERRYYLASVASDVTQFAQAVRGHWGIENSLHWVLDVTFREDDCRIRKGAAPENFTVLRHMAINLLNRDASDTRSLAMKRRRAGWDNAYLARILLA
jgi:predicted transposase YbfD/YdcC